MLLVTERGGQLPALVVTSSTAITFSNPKRKGGKVLRFLAYASGYNTFPRLRVGWCCASSFTRRVVLRLLAYASGYNVFPRLRVGL